MTLQLGQLAANLGLSGFLRERLCDESGGANVSADVPRSTIKSAAFTPFTPKR